MLIKDQDHLKPCFIFIPSNKQTLHLSSSKDHLNNSNLPRMCNCYMPAYDFNWDEYASYKANGGTLKDFPNKSYSQLTEQRLLNHLSGEEVIGLYPLLPDNSSWFITADFDETESEKINWQNEVKLFMDTC